ncbi:MATE family efflux transporter [Agriterribacter sp.]|uniref:MATE family efflux transporter n=1 Tax=Agriterribacter sp. TaxID=2821509 RepID=UPI002C4C1A2B|nr:MATE family efflux transporter [Agriterribacter sp.]HRO45458.1 MATE family efflux transporter [Agriterribacter sp.]HRQ19175.1 MATE family efflux transporter [Agriterribacter sp.]
MHLSLWTEAKSTLRLSFPIILGELAQMALHIIDTAMVGALGYKQLAAGALVLAVLNIPFVIGIGMTISVSQLVSMSHGRKDAQKVSHYFYNGFWLCAVTAVVISLALVLGKNVLFHLKQDPEVAALAVPFLELMGWSVIPMLLFMSLKQFTDGLERTRTAMVISLVALPVNIFINWLLIFGNWGFPRLELPGAGWGTLITRSLMFFTLGAVILWHPLFRRYIIVRKNQWKLRLKTIKELLHIGVPSSLQVGMEGGAFAVSGIIIGTIGATEQAAHQIALSCASFTFMVSMGLAQGSSIRVSNAYGGRNSLKITAIGKSTLITALLYGTLCAAIFISFRNILPVAFNENTSVIRMAALLLIYAAVFQISDATQAIAAGLLRGIKDVKVPTLLIGIAYWIVGIPVGYVLAFNTSLGASGIWIGFIAGLSCSSLFLCYRFLRMAKKV